MNVFSKLQFSRTSESHASQRHQSPPGACLPTRDGNLCQPPWWKVAPKSGLNKVALNLAGPELASYRYSAGCTPPPPEQPPWQRTRDRARYLVRGSVRREGPRCIYPARPCLKRRLKAPGRIAGRALSPIARGREGLWRRQCQVLGTCACGRRPARGEPPSAGADRRPKQTRPRLRPDVKPQRPRKNRRTKKEAQRKGDANLGPHAGSETNVDCSGYIFHHGDPLWGRGDPPI